MRIDRGLSIRQPFAWAVCANVKRFENRTWTTNYRGTIAIHASASQQNVNDLLSYDADCILQKDYFQFGAIIGLADIVDIQSYGPQHESNSFASGPYCWEMANGRLLSKPVPMKGKLNLFKVPSDIQAQIEHADAGEVDFTMDKVAAHVADLMDGDPDPVLAYHELLDECLHTGNHIEASRIAAGRLVELDSSNPSSFNLRGYILWTPETAEERLADFERAIELDCQFEAAWDNLVAAIGSLKQYEKMLSKANEYVSYFPDSALAYEQRGRALYWLMRYNEALVDCDKAINLDPNSGVKWALRAEVKRELGDSESASEDIEHAVRLEPEEEEWKVIATGIRSV